MIAVEVGDTFSVCDNNGCKTGRNGEEKAPEHVYLGGGGGGSSDDNFEGNTGQRSSGRGINWEQLCLDYGNIIDIETENCGDYANGNQLTQAGEDVLACNLILRVPSALADAGTGIIGDLAARFLC
jgi:hypothetical protein